MSAGNPIEKQDRIIVGILDDVCGWYRPVVRDVQILARGHDIAHRWLIWSRDIPAEWLTVREQISLKLAELGIDHRISFLRRTRASSTTVTCFLYVETNNSAFAVEV